MNTMIIPNTVKKITISENAFSEKTTIDALGCKNLESITNHSASTTIWMDQDAKARTYGNNIQTYTVHQLTLHSKKEYYSDENVNQYRISNLTTDGLIYYLDTSLGASKTITWKENSIFIFENNAYPLLSVEWDPDFNRNQTIVIPSTVKTIDGVMFNGWKGNLDISHTDFIWDTTEMFFIQGTLTVNPEQKALLDQEENLSEHGTNVVLAEEFWKIYLILNEDGTFSDSDGYIYQLDKRSNLVAHNYSEKWTKDTIFVLPDDTEKPLSQVSIEEAIPEE